MSLCSIVFKTCLCLSGGYREALDYPPPGALDEPIEFNVNGFISSRPVTMRPFLVTLLSLQAFEQFIGDRLEMLNADRGFKGRFESEADRFSNKPEVHQRYSEWIRVC